MDRRKFLQTLVGGVAATAAVRSWPFRVFSFPSEIAAPPMLTRIDILQGWSALKPDFAVRVFNEGDIISFGKDPRRFVVIDCVSSDAKIKPLRASSYREGVIAKAFGFEWDSETFPRAL